jgi:hypothetical protein
VHQEWFVPSVRCVALVALFPDKGVEFRLIGAAPDEAAIETGVSAGHEIGTLVEGESKITHTFGAKLCRSTTARLDKLPFCHTFTLALEAFGHGFSLQIRRKMPYRRENCKEWTGWRPVGNNPQSKGRDWCPEGVIFEILCGCSEM